MFIERQPQTWYDRKVHVTHRVKFQRLAWLYQLVLTWDHAYPDPQFKKLEEFQERGLEASLGARIPEEHLDDLERSVGAALKGWAQRASSGPLMPELLRLTEEAGLQWARAQWSAQSRARLKTPGEVFEAFLESPWMPVPGEARVTIDRRSPHEVIHALPEIAQRSSETAAVLIAWSRGFATSFAGAVVPETTSDQRLRWVARSS